jgi:isopenicillin N synthase-like dioxygenase
MAKKKQTSRTSESSFNNLFLLNKTEKKKIFNIMTKKHINYLLFYTDYRNLKNILNYGIRPLKDVKLVKDEVYYV